MIAEHVVVAADPSTAFQAVRTLDLLTVRTPLLVASMWIRDLPARLSGKATPAATFDDGREYRAAGLVSCWVSGRTASCVRRGGEVLAASH